MKEKALLFKKSLGAVWKSAPGWAMANTLVSLLKSFLPLVLIWLIKMLVDSITELSATPGSPTEMLLLLLLAIAAVWFIDEVASDISTFVRKRQSVDLEAYMYDLLHKKAIKLDLIYFENAGYFDKLSRATRDAPWRPNSILNNIVSLFRGTISLVLMAGVLFSFHWGLALLLIAVNIPGIWLRLHYADILYNFQRELTPEARKMAYFNWLLTGNRPARELRLFGLGPYFATLFKKSFSNTKEEEVKIVGRRTVIDIFSDAFKAAAIFFMLFFIAKRSVAGTISLGEMSMYLLAFRQGMVYIKELFGSVSGLYEDSLFVGDTFEFLDLPENIKTCQPQMVCSGLTDKIVVDNLSFAYPESEKMSIDGVSFEIKKGEVIALVGPNGAGKSTLARLLARLYDSQSGSIQWDGTDIKQFCPEEYRQQVSVLFQDFMLYNMTVQENISMGDIHKEVDTGKIEKVAKDSGIDALVKSLPNGYNTQIGNLFGESRDLSWGEWQKLALSRALYRDADLIILDEPSSSLDAATEFEIFTRFREIIKDKTTVLISHRFSNVALADRIIVLDKGRVVETGSHTQLMLVSGLYRSMYETQNALTKE